MSPRILAVEIRDELYAIVREPAAIFFSIAMRVGFFALFATLFGGDAEGPVSNATLMLATFGAFGVISVALLTLGSGSRRTASAGGCASSVSRPCRCPRRWQRRSWPACRSRSACTRP